MLQYLLKNHKEGEPKLKRVIYILIIVSLATSNSSISFAIPSKKAKGKTIHPLDGFEKSKWTVSYITQGRFESTDKPSTFSHSSTQVYRGSYSGKLEYRWLSKKKEAIMLTPARKLLIPGIVTSISLHVYGNASGDRISIRLRDNTGEYFRIFLGQDNKKGWHLKHTKIKANKIFRSHWKTGNNNQLIDFPSFIDAIIIEHNPKNKNQKGTLYFDSLQVASKPFSPLLSFPKKFAPCYGEDATIAFGVDAIPRDFKLTLSNATQSKTFFGTTSTKDLTYIVWDGKADDGSYLTGNISAVLQVDKDNNYVYGDNSYFTASNNTFLAVTNKKLPAGSGLSSTFGSGIYISRRFSYNERERAAELAENLNVSWSREEFYWTSIEPTKSRFEWTSYDHGIFTCYAHNINMIGLLAYSPKWASSNPNHPLFDRYMPKNIDDWKNFVFRVVNRYKDKIKYWEIWNEPNTDEHFRGSIKDYVKLVKTAHQMIKKADPKAKIVIGTAGTDLPFFQKIYQYGGLDYVDVISIHPYRPQTATPFQGDCGIPENTRYLEELNDIKAFVDVYCPDKPIWITEMSWSTAHVTEKAQSIYLPRAIAIARTIPDISLFINYELRDHEIPNSNSVMWHNTHYGILRNNYSEKPAYRSYQSIIKLLQGTTFVKSKDSYPGQWQPLANFADISGWRLQTASLYTSLQQSTETLYQDKPSLKLDYSFDTDQVDNVSLVKPFTLPEKPKKLRMQIFGDDSGSNLTLTIKDASSETLLFYAGKINWRGWKQVEFPLDKAHIIGHKGGNNNGKLDYPATFISLNLDDSIKSFEPTKGLIYLSNFEVGYGPTDLYHYVFEGRGKTIHTIWKVSKSAEITMNIPSETATLIDTYGNEQTVYPDNNTLTITADASPKYIVYDNLPSPISIISPTDNQTTPYGLVDITTVAANETFRIDFFIDGKLEYVSTSSPFFYTWDTTRHSAGKHTIEIVAYDVYGLIGEAKSEVIVPPPP